MTNVSRLVVLQLSMRVLLFYPWFPKTFWSFDRAVELMGHRVLLPPLGLITVAALLPQHWDFQLVDCNVREVIGDAVGGDSRKPSWVGLSISRVWVCS